MKRRQTSLPGFTLIELLTVIAVISILAGILIAAISSARQMARTAECASNLRNLGISLNLFAQENSGKLPTAGNYNVVEGAGTNMSWMYALNDFLAARFPDMNEKSILLCPSAAETYPNGDARRTYGMNAAGTGGDIAMNPNWFLKPASTVLLMDTKHNGGGDGYFAFGAGSYDQYVDWRHDDGTNVLFMDGHVERIEKADVAQLREYVLNYQLRE
ncbi:MAG: prepilin-type N-terminal cleavage/methylation domain-containing protein [Verrucomicrobiota bacterium JB024]|nr:prepilin-type N-terminal cleavage/methylation domain-containing protein [Verrucomicrobiota bacterium JB024]